MINDYHSADMATILSTAELTHYLVGVEDVQGNFTPFTNANNPAKFRSIDKAKKYLREHRVVRAKIKYQTAYGEMCGLPSSDSFYQLIEL